MIRQELRLLHSLAGKPTADNLKRHADLRRHSVARATLWAVISDDDTKRLRWATVEAFIDACDSYADARGRPLATDAVSIPTWQALFAQAYDTERPTSTRAWPRRVGVVPRLADCFQSRAATDVLSEATTGGGTAVLTGMTIGLMSGLSGVGKTQLAVHLAEQLWRDQQLDLLVWINAASRQAIRAGYAQTAVDLSVPGANGVDTEQDAARFHAWLTTTNRRWLVVLDDLANTSDLQGLWPPTSATGRTVVTTQLRGSALQGTGRYFIQVGTFTPDEAVRHLRSRLTDHPELADDVDGMANDLGLLPLALAQAAAFIIDEQVPCSEYRRRFADRRSRLDDLVPDPNGPVGLPDDYGRTVATTLSLSIERGQRSRPVGLARPLMELASVLDPAGIPVTVFGTIAALNWLAYRRCLTHPDTGAGADATLVQSGLQALHRLNLVNIESGNVTVHGLVQRTTREFCSDEQLADVAWAAADAVAEVWPVIERDAPYAQQLRSSTTIVYQHGADALLKPDPHPVLFRAADSLGNSGDPAGAAAAFEQMLTSLVQVFGPDHPYTLATRGNLAAWRGRAGDLAGAATTFEQLLVDRLRVFGPDHPDTLTIRNNLAYCRGQAGNPAGAAAAFEQLAADLARVLGPDHPDTLTTRGNLSRWRGEAGNPVGAAAAFEQLLADFLRVLGPDHPDTLTTRNNLVFWRGQAGDLAGATHATEQLLADRLRVFGPDHPDTLTTRSNLARCHAEAGDLASAIAAYEQMVADFLRVLGPDHPDTLTVRDNLAYRRGQAGDLAGAAAAFEQLLADRLRVFGPDHPDTLTTGDSLAYWRLGAADSQ